MTIAFRLPGMYMEIGPGKLFHAFCSTIAVHLEDGLWGTRFPVLQQRLYDGRVVAEDARMLMLELDAIRSGLRKFPPDKVVWRNEDGTTPEWVMKAGPHVTDLSR